MAAARFAGMLGKKVLPALRTTMRTSADSDLLTDIVANFGIDAAFGVMQGVMTPGDLREKLLAGTSTAVGGAVGDYAQRLTSPDGKTAYERLAEDERRQVEQQTLAALGLGGYNLDDLVGMV